MSSTPRTVTVVGAGVVGASIAYELLARGVSVRVVAGDEARASDVPVAIAQPIMGRHASASPLRIAAWRHACRLVESVAPEAVLSRGLLRFTSDAPTATRWRERCAALPATVASWCSTARCRELAPGLGDDTCGGIWIPDALALDLRLVVEKLLRGVPFVREAVASVAVDADRASVVTEHGDALASDLVVVAAGVRSLSLLAPHGNALLPWRGTMAGEVVHVMGAAPPIMMGEKGQIVPLRDGRVALTASQRPEGQATLVDPEGVAQLLERYSAALPAGPAPSVVDAWVGQRSTTLDAHPVVGPLDSDRRLWVCSGMGSRGVIFGTYAAHALVAELCGSHGEIPAEWAPYRRTARHPGRRPEQ